MSLLTLGFSFFQESRDRHLLLDTFVVLLSSYFCDGYWLNSSREARAGNSSIGMQKKYLSASWIGEVGTGHQEGLDYQSKSRAQLKGKLEREEKALENVVCWLDEDRAE